MSDNQELPEQVIAEAGVWMARLRADDRTEQDVRDFQAWFASDLSHFAAFEHVSLVWETAGGAVSAHYIRKERAAPLLKRRALLASLGAAAIAGGSLSFWKAAEANTYRTDVGEQKHVTLDDGTKIFLDTDTCCRIHLTDRTRAAELRYGRANFHIMPDGDRTFSVRAAENTVRTIQSRFDVRTDRDTNKMSLVVIQGRTFVDASNALQNSPQVVNAGEQLIAAPSSPSVVSKANLKQLTAWHRGQVIFENTRLASALYEMNRYSDTKLVIENSAMADLRISGVYSVGDNDAFANSVSYLLPVKTSISHRDDRIIIVSDRNHT